MAKNDDVIEAAIAAVVRMHGANEFIQSASVDPRLKQLSFKRSRFFGIEISIQRLGVLTAECFKFHAERWHAFRSMLLMRLFGIVQARTLKDYASSDRTIKRTIAYTRIFQATIDRPAMSSIRRGIPRG
jgi:hypothetical protein